MQLHQLNNDSISRWIPESGINTFYGCMDESAVNYNANATNPSVCYYLGDMNNDGVIDGQDLYLLERYLTDSDANPLSPAQILAGDINQDGVTDEAD